MRSTVDAVGADGGVDPVRPPTVPIRPLAFRELLDEPFALIQAQLRPLAVLGGSALVLAVLAVLGFTGLVSHLTGGTKLGTMWALLLATLGCGWLVRLVLRGTTVALALADFRGARFGLRAALRTASDHLGPLLLAQLMFALFGVGILVVGSLLIVTYPLAVLWLSYVRAGRFAVEPAIIGEHAGYGVAVARSKELTQGAEWRLAGLWLLQRVLFAVLAVPAFGIPSFLSDFSGTHRWAFFTLLVSGWLLVVVVAEIVESASRAVCYIDRRCVREGLDIKIPGAPG
ncbi:hypothetical protein [Nocardia sp. SSK8]|uniref:hypothetical protein n=1 Tax=Nocardia sp. SSK8 TaxID=3120154 RepID=UPI003009D728